MECVGKIVENITEYEIYYIGTYGYISEHWLFSNGVTCGSAIKSFLSDFYREAFMREKELENYNTYIVFDGEVFDNENQSDDFITKINIFKNSKA